MGISGAGKSTLGQALAAALRWTFVEGDDYHPKANVEKMRAGLPLDDDDRRPWLQALNDKLRQLEGSGTDAVVTCSALKSRYRSLLDRGIVELRYVYLHGDPSLIRQRMSARKDHFMPSDLLDSQIAAMEPPHDAIQVDVALTLQEQVRRVRQALGRA